MKSAKIFIVFTFLLAFTVCVSAQDKTPKIVWKNLQKEYEKFEDIKPHIELQDTTFILWKYLPRYNPLFRFDEKEEKWIEGNYILSCGVGAILDNLILQKDKTLDFFFYSGQFFECERSKGCFFISSNRERYSVNGKYKIRFYYGFELDKLENFSDSPEFFIDGKYYANN